MNSHVARSGNPVSMRNIEGQAGVRNRRRHANVDVLSERRRDLLLEEPSKATVPRVDSTQQFALKEAESQRVIRLTRSRLPCRLLAGEYHREAIQVGDQAAIDGLVKGK